MTAPIAKILVLLACIALLVGTGTRQSFASHPGVGTAPAQIQGTSPYTYDFAPSNPSHWVKNFLQGNHFFTNDMDYNRDGRIDMADATHVARGLTLYRVNAGGGQYTDPWGNVWAADSGNFFTGGTTFSTSAGIANTYEAPLYQTERASTTASNTIEYRFAAAPGCYAVRIYQAEIFQTAPGARVFDVYLEDIRAFQNVDLVAWAGGANKSIILGGTAMVYDGELTVKLVGIVSNAKVAAIEVIRIDEIDAGLPVVSRVNVGGADYTDPFGRFWTGDAAFSLPGAINSSAAAISGTILDPIYQTERYVPPGSAPLIYSYSPAPSGEYIVRLHFAELFANAAGERLFHVAVENDAVLVDYDILGRVPKFTANVIEHRVRVTDGSLDIRLFEKTGDPKLSAFEILRLFTGELTPFPDALSWPILNAGEIGDTLSVTLSNTGDSPIRITSMAFRPQTGQALDFTAIFDGQTYAGDRTDRVYPVDVTLQPGDNKLVPLTFMPTEESQNLVALDFAGENFSGARVLLSGVVGGEGHGSDGFLHVVIENPAFVVDFDGNGFESVALAGDKSHTHEIGKQLVGYEWRDNGGSVFSTEVNPTANFPVGDHTVTLTIIDNNNPPRRLSDDASFRVFSGGDIPGAIAFYYQNRTAAPEFMLDSVPPRADFVERTGTFRVGENGGKVGASNYTGDIMVILGGRIQISAPGTYNFEAVGGSDRRLLVNGAPHEGAVFLNSGEHSIEARFSLNDVGQMPIFVRYGSAGQTLAEIPGSLVFHSEIGLPPVINSISPLEGKPVGGEFVEIAGLGFLPSESVEVRWGNFAIGRQFMNITPEKITFFAPGGVGLVTVVIRTPNGDSNAVRYNYTESAPVPVKFVGGDWFDLPSVTRITWGPDGRLYFATLNGTIYASTIGDNYEITSTQTIATIAGLYNNNILGIGFNPSEPSNPVRIYVGHSQLYANGGSCFTGFSPYSGQISVLEGPNFSTAIPIITQLPASNHDHAVNHIEFDNLGVLYAAIGGNTNAGVPDCALGGLDESPFSAAVIVADVRKPGFNGAIQYQFGSGALSDDQSFGKFVDPIAGVDVFVYAAGLRNAFDILWSTKGLLYALDNGGDPGFGASSTGPNSQSGAPDAPDELELLEGGKYYGAANRNRGRYDFRQNIYHPGSSLNSTSDYTAPLSTFSYSTNGLEEYRANTFRGAMRGNLLAQVYNSELVRIKLSADGRVATNQIQFPVEVKALDLITGPGGTVIAADYNNNKLKIYFPDDAGVQGLTVYDIYPWRTRASGGDPFVIGGVNFGGNLANVTVTIGGVAAPLTSVSPTRIRGIVPARQNPPNSMLDVAVTVDGVTIFLREGFRYVADR